jgi:hypothetical protein
MQTGLRPEAGMADEVSWAEYGLAEGTDWHEGKGIARIEPAWRLCNATHGCRVMYLNAFHSLMFLTVR